jgi:hypothetical protein
MCWTVVWLGLEGLVLSIELRDDTTVVGRVENIEDDMTYGGAHVRCMSRA